MTPATTASDLAAAPSVAAPANAIRKLSDLPGPRPGLLFGNARQIDSLRFHRSMEAWARQYGSLYQFSITGNRKIVVTTDSEVIAAMLRDRPETLRRSARGAGILEEIGTRGVFSAEGEEWRTQRKLVMRALTPGVINSFFPTLSMMTERLLRRWNAAIDAGKTVDVLRDLKAYTLDVTIGMAMGQDINTLENETDPLQRDIEFVFNRIARRITAPFPYWRYVRLPVDRAADRSALRIRESIAKFVQQTRHQLEIEPARRAKPTNLLEALVVARDEPESGFTDANVIGNAVTMVFAGEDTTSNTVAWLLDLLARNPHASSAMAEEADLVLGEATVLDSFTLLDSLAYVDAATKEAMRIKPVAPFLGLETNQDTVISHVAMPKGTMIMALSRDLYGTREFRPERWLPDATASEAAETERNSYPFGGGPRFCPGRYLAMAEIKMVMSMILKNFTLSITPGAAPVEENFTFTMTPSALPLVLSRRATV